MLVGLPGHRIRFPWESRSGSNHEHHDEDPMSRLPLVKHLSPSAKNHLVAVISEFVGTFLFLLFAYGGTNAVNIAPTSSGDDLNADPAKLLYISLCFGMSLAVNAVSYQVVRNG